MSGVDTLVAMARDCPACRDAHRSSALGFIEMSSQRWPSMSWKLHPYMKAWSMGSFDR